MPELTPDQVLALARSGTSAPASTAPAASSSGWTGADVPTQTGTLSWSADDLAMSYWNLNPTDSSLLVRDRETQHNVQGVNLRESERTGVPSRSKVGTVTTVNPTTYGAILQRLGTMSNPERTALQKDLKAAGYLDKFRAGVPDDATVKAFSTLLMETARSSTSNKMLTWQDMLDQRITEAETSATEKTTTSSVANSITTKESGRGVIWDAFKSAVGRDPSESEINKFMDHLNAKERANPSISTTTTDAQGNSTTSTTGGFDAAAQADTVRQEVMSNPHYAEHQAIANYMPMLDNAMKASQQLEGGL